MIAVTIGYDREKPTKDGVQTVQDEMKLHLCLPSPNNRDNFRKARAPFVKKFGEMGRKADVLDEEKAELVAELKDKKNLNEARRLAAENRLLELEDELQDYVAEVDTLKDESLIASLRACVVSTEREQITDDFARNCNIKEVGDAVEKFRVSFER